MLRPIDVIFKHPVKKFTVIYQNGKLWQLPRLDFDGGSLVYKRPYTGSREQIFVAQDQSLPAEDILLRSQLATLPLPVTVVGRNVDQFEHWWRQNSFECRELSAQAKLEQEHAKTQLANPNAVPNAAGNVGNISNTTNIAPNAPSIPIQTLSAQTIPAQTHSVTAEVENTLPSQPATPTMANQASVPSITPSVMPSPNPVPPVPVSTVPVPRPISSPQPASDEEDIFDQMMGDLTQNLR